MSHNSKYGLRSPDAWKSDVFLLLILLFAIALRVYEFRGFGAVDDAAYAKIAHEIAQGRFSPGTYEGPAVFPLRVGILYPTALLFRYFGVSEWSMVFFPFLLSVLTVLLAYFCTNYFFGHRAALLAAAIWAILPVDAFYATILVPDLPSAFFASLAVFVILLLASSRVGYRPVGMIGGLGAGVLLGVSWLCKESVVYLAPFCAFLMIATVRQDWRRNFPIWIGVGFGSFSVLLAEMYFYRVATGDWLFHFHEMERNYRQHTNAFFVPGSKLAAAGSGFHEAVLRRLLVSGPMTIFLKSQFLYLPLFAAIAVLHAIYWRNKSFLIPAVWFVTLVLMFNFSSSSFTSYVPLVLFDRYLYPILLPATMLSAGFLANLFTSKDKGQDEKIRKEGVFWGVLIVLVLALISVFQNYSNRKWYTGWVSEVKAVSTLLKPSDRLYTDILSIHGLDFFWGYPEKMAIVNFEDMARSTRIHANSYVLVNRKYLDWLASKAGWWPTKSEQYRKPEFYDLAPASWKRIWSDGDATLYFVE
jgi:4-amino-4-deoxy-L-arabinose transferase-like glycosyltransferase